MRIKFLLTGVVFLLSVMTAQAVPAKPGVKKTVKLANGTSVEVSLRGDEHFSYYTDDSGQPYLLKGQIAIPVDREYVAETWKSKMARSNAERTRRAITRGVGEPSSSNTGKHRGLVILMQFNDVKFVTENANTVFNRFFNEQGYSEYGMTGSVKDYFIQQSYGQLEIDFDVAGPYTTKHDMEYYGAPTENSHDVNPQGMIAEAVDAAANDVDFSNYDWDKDGLVDQVFIVYAGYNQAQGADVNTIWPHESGLGSLARKYNGVIINTYACSSELRGNGVNNPGQLDGIGTACHEFSHCLGLPDMYDTSDSGTNYGMGYWDIMCSGSYNDYSRTPAGYTSYERWFSGWLTPTELKERKDIIGMKPLVESPECYIMYNEGNKNEYYMLENRQLKGFDAGLAGHGLLVLHVNYNEKAWTANTVNAGTQCMTIIPADNQADGYTEYADPYPGTKNVTALTNYTTPASTLYNNNSDGTKLMNKPISNITESSDGLISFVVCHPGVEPPVFSSDATETSDGFTINWSAVTDATSYEIELTEIPAATKDTAEAKRFQMYFSKCYSKTTGFTDISSKLSSYGFPDNWSGSKLYTSPYGLKVGTNSTTGYISSPWYYAPESGEFTVVLGTASDAITGTLSFSFADVEGSSIIQSSITEQSVDFEFTKAGLMVFNFKTLQGAYRHTIAFDKIAYMNYYALYYGTFNAKELGIDEIAGSIVSAKRRATTTTLSTSDTNYTFTGLTKTSTFQYRVRAIGPEVTSGWSELQTFKFSTTGINSISANTDKAVRYFDLQGREVSKDTRGLLIRKQGSDVKKIIVK